MLHNMCDCSLGLRDSGGCCLHFPLSEGCWENAEPHGGSSPARKRQAADTDVSSEKGPPSCSRGSRAPHVWWEEGAGQCWETGGGRSQTAVGIWFPNLLCPHPVKCSPFAEEGDTVLPLPLPRSVGSLVTQDEKQAHLGQAGSPLPPPSTMLLWSR